MYVLKVIWNVALVAGILAVVGVAFTLMVYAGSAVFSLPELRAFILNDPVQYWFWVFSGLIAFFTVIGLFRKSESGLKPATMALAGVMALAAMQYGNVLYLALAGIVLFAGFIAFVRGRFDPDDKHLHSFGVPS